MSDGLFDMPTTVEEKTHSCSGDYCQVCGGDPVARAASTQAAQTWMVSARKAVTDLADSGAEFSADDVWFTMSQRGIPQPPEPRALGAVMRAAIRDRVIVQTGYTKSARRHSTPIAVYRKCVP